MAKKKIGMVSLGCPKNLVDSEVMMGLLARNGYELTSDPKAAQIIVINTCGFIDAARQESIETILEMAKLKETGSLERLIVAGCLVERYRDQLQREIPEIDACIGVNQLEDVLLAVGPDRGKLVPIYSEGAAAPELYLYDETKPRLRATPPYTAYVKISEGCDHVCSFCIIPKLRGAFRSRPPESILKEIEQLVAEGVSEVILISQDTTNYGADLGLKEGLAKLIEAAARVPGLKWLRFLYCYPTGISDELLRVVAENENVCSYFDIPLQHSSRRILSMMRRGGNRELYERLIDRIRERVPGATIRTTFIVGFPGERDEDFEDLLDFVRKVEFDRAGVFTYSDEEGSAAFELSEKVDPRVARRRARILIREQARISRRKNRALVGSRARVLFEGLSKESELLFEGRMESQAPEIDGSVFINEVPEGFKAAPGDFVTVEITRAGDYDLVGRVV